MKIFNTLTRRKEEFVPLEPGKVKMYVCGPTVYNFIHIGNARPMIIFDTVRRYFEYKGYEVNYVSNFTDVDDKIINRAKEEGITPQEVADKYIAAFREDVTALGVKPATRHPRVVEFMDDIIRFVADLIEKGYAYESQGDVYFRVEKSHSREIGGTGLGLSIARNAVVMHRGAIKVYSEPGEGTTFTVRIPLTYIKREG